MTARYRALCWTPTWNKDREGVGLRHLRLTEGVADSVVLAFDEDGRPFRERRQFVMAWVAAPELTVHPVPQAYTRLANQRYLFENLDGSGFRAELPVDEDGIVLDYPGHFRRVS